jgi:hypothetical protein
MPDDSIILGMRRGGATYAQVTETLKISEAEAQAAVRRALGILPQAGDELVDALIETQRLDNMLLKLWPQANQGHQGAVDRVMKINERKTILAERIRQLTPQSSPFPASEKTPGQAASRQAYKGFTGLGDKPAWEADYNALRAEGWTWRVAIYIAWAASPTKDRWPATEEELANQVLGLKSSRSIRKWRTNKPEIDERVAEYKVEPVFRRLRDIIDTMITVATTPDSSGFQDRKLALTIGKVYDPKGTLELSGPDGGQIKFKNELDLSDKTVDELERIIANIQAAIGAAGNSLSGEEPADPLDSESPGLVDLDDFET